MSFNNKELDHILDCIERNDIEALKFEPLHKEPNGRGLYGFKFLDRYQVECSIQNSSLATTSAIWIGVTDSTPFYHIDIDGHKAGDKVTLPPGTISHSRMHLTQAQVKSLIPILQEFADTGELPMHPQDNANVIEGEVVRELPLLI
jgi:hypothetical protein